MNPGVVREPLVGLLGHLGHELVRKEGLADATGTEVHDPVTSMLGPWGRVGVTVWHGMSRMALHDKVDEVLGELARARHQGPEQDQGETAIGNALHRVTNLGDPGASVKQMIRFIALDSPVPSHFG